MPSPLNPQEATSHTHCTGSWMGPTVSLDALEKWKTSHPCQE